MRTEITIPFAFDTTPIETMLQEHGEEEAMKILNEIVTKQVIGQIPKKSGYYGASNQPDWSGLMRDCFNKWLNDHTEEIVDEAAMLLAAKAGRKKTWREVLAEVKESQ